MNIDLRGRVAAITGGSEGTGRETALKLARSGASIAICARREDVLQVTAAEIRAAGAQALAVVGDVLKAEDIARVIEQTVQQFARIDILVNNAGATGQSAFDTVADTQWRTDIELKVMAHVQTARAAIPHMKKQGSGRIINLNMVAAKQPGAKQFPTTVSRAAGLALIKGLSRELAEFNILVNAVAVGKIKSKQQERSAARFGLSVEEHYARTGATVPHGRRRGGGKRNRLPGFGCRQLCDGNLYQR